jgi:hypothetical protein
MSKRPEQHCSMALVLWNILQFSFFFFPHTNNNNSNSLLLYSDFGLFCCYWPRLFGCCLCSAALGSDFLRFS